MENRRLSTGKTAQRTVLYLGEVNDSQERAWRKTLEVFDEAGQSQRLSLFPEDRALPEDGADSLQVRLSGLQLCRPRSYGDCWLACELWRQLGLDEFWQQRLPDGREAVSWEKVLRLLVVNRLIDPGSEFRVHRQWFHGPARWMSCWEWITGLRKRIDCIAVWTGCWPTSRIYSCGLKQALGRSVPS